MRHDQWICCQLGAREHYAIPRALHACGALERLVTDAWVPPGNPLGRLSAGLRERFHPDLPDGSVTAANLGIAAFELRARLARLGGWHRILARNAWFQKMAIRRLCRMEDGRAPRTVFAYSYAARDILKHARARGWRTVLGQIDPGPAEERIVARLHQENPGQVGRWEAAPPAYWEHWHEECRLADRIVVNSAWSRKALLEEGVPEAKLQVVPLAYEGPAEAASFHRRYPERFTGTRPLRVLFLGQVNLRKGLGPTMDALRELRNEAMEVKVAGPVQIALPEDLKNRADIHWTGPVSRGGTAELYRWADLFLFPSLSDGFGLTQLEAQAWKLPVIASRFCGEVVIHERNGLVLPEVTAPVIAAALRRCAREPATLARWSAAAVGAEEFGLARLADRLMGLFGEEAEN